MGSWGNGCYIMAAVVRYWKLRQPSWRGEDVGSGLGGSLDPARGATRKQLAWSYVTRAWQAA
jgi:hypothetical protein